MRTRQTILTGDRPTGPLHLGHYLGSLQNRVSLQDEYITYVLIADVQALTDNFLHPQILMENTLELMLDYLAVGLDPNKVTFVLQSLVPEIHELAVYYLNLVTVARAMRNPTVKSEIEEKRSSQSQGGVFGKNMDFPLGFLVYPIHQAADITAFDADLVPVGEDQLPMIEQTREIVRRLNNLYGKHILVEPKAKLGNISRLPGIDGRAKMGKSLDNAIYLKSSPDEVRKRVMRMYTDPNRIRADVPGEVQGNPLFIYHDAFNPDGDEVQEFKRRYRAGTVGDVEVKKRLAEVLNDVLAPIRARRLELEPGVEDIKEMLIAHTARARKKTREVLERVRTSMCLLPSIRLSTDNLGNDSK